MSTSNPVCAPRVTAVPAMVSSDKRLRHRGGNRVDLRLRLHQNLVAHLEIGGDLPGADRIVGDQIDRRRRSAPSA